MSEPSRFYLALASFKGADGDENNLTGQFEEIAKAAFYSGYFAVTGDDGTYKIKITCIEFYYHEDEGNVKDPRKYLKGNKEFGYALGAICPNPSGIDVLFDDNQTKKYHASFLIRGYKLDQDGEEPYENTKGPEKPFEWKPQDLWFDLFGGANMLKDNHFSIEWEDNKEDYSSIILPKPHKRVFPNYTSNEDNRLWRYSIYNEE